MGTKVLLASLFLKNLANNGKYRATAGTASSQDTYHYSYVFKMHEYAHTPLA